MYIHAKIGVPFDKIQRAISREEIDGRNLIKASSIPEGNLEDFVRKNKYEELQKKYELLLKKHEESKHRQKHFEMNYIKEKKLADELSIENNKLKAKIRELEEKNKDLLASQHTG